MNKSHGREHRRKKAWEEPGQVTSKKRTERKPLMKYRKRRDDVKTVGSRYCGISSDRACRWAERHPVQRWPELAQEAVERNVGTWDCDANGKATNGRTIRAKVRKHSPGAEQPVVAEKSPTKGWSEGVELWSHHSMSQPAMGGA
jgi:hypothetical protein